MVPRQKCLVVPIQETRLPGERLLGNVRNKKIPGGLHGCLRQRHLLSEERYRRSQRYGPVSEDRAFTERSRGRPQLPLPTPPGGTPGTRATSIRSRAL